ncbi:unnamed protein product, partial [Allacma fusca]
PLKEVSCFKINTLISAFVLNPGKMKVNSLTICFFTIIMIMTVLNIQFGLGRRRNYGDNRGQGSYRGYGGGGGNYRRYGVGRYGRK